MLELNKRPPPDESAQTIWGPPGGESRSFLKKLMQRQLPTIIVLMILTIGLGVFYALTAAPIYTAAASIVIDIRNPQSFQQKSPGPEPPIDASEVPTQIEILKSRNVSRSAIQQLRLGEDPEFNGDGDGGFMQKILRLKARIFGSERPPTPAEMERRVLDAFESKRTVTRVGQSYVMEIDAQSTDPEKSAQIANAIADAYIDDQLEAKYQATRRASTWLQDRLKELRAEASNQQRAVVDFRAKNNIVDTGGRLMNDQQISEVNSQLIIAQAATAEAKARYDRIRQIMNQEVPDASIADALKNELIIKLRERYLDLVARETLLSEKYGSGHLAVVGLRSQMREILRSIKDEMRKIEESYKSDYQIAQAREQSLSNSLGAAVAQSQMKDHAQVQLQELESGAQTSKSLYDNFLQRYMDAVQQQSFPITEARVISFADTPSTKSFPKTSLVLLLATAIGLVLSFGIASLRELTDRVFRSSEQVEEVLSVNCLAMLPLLKAASAVKSEESSDVEALSCPPSRSRLVRPHAILDHVLSDPLSQFTEGLSAVKVATDFNGVMKSKRVIGITSTLPHEGKSTIAANFAQMIAHSGASVILIDADLRNPTLSRQLAPDSAGLIEVIVGFKSIDDVLMLDPRSGLKFLSAGAKSQMLHTNELLASDMMRNVVESLRQSYDYIIVDLPPLIPVIDARVTTNFVDAFLYVLEWGRSRIDAAKHGLGNAPEIYERLIGVVINKVDMSAIRSYERYRSDYYYKKYNAQYGSSSYFKSDARRRTAKTEL